MLELKLAWRGLVHHGQQYGMFIFASAVLVALNYIFTALVNNSSYCTAVFDLCINAGGCFYVLCE